MGPTNYHFYFKVSEATALEKLEVSRIKEKELTSQVLRLQQAHDGVQDQLVSLRSQHLTDTKQLRAELNVSAMIISRTYRIVTTQNWLRFFLLTFINDVLPQALRLQYSGAITLAQQETYAHHLKEQAEARAKLRIEMDEVAKLKASTQIMADGLEIERRGMQGMERF